MSAQKHSYFLRWVRSTRRDYRCISAYATGLGLLAASSQEQKQAERCSWGRPCRWQQKSTKGRASPAAAGSCWRILLELCCKSSQGPLWPVLEFDTWHWGMVGGRCFGRKWMALSGWLWKKVDGFKVGGERPLVMSACYYVFRWHPLGVLLLLICEHWQGTLSWGVFSHET